MLNKDPLQIVIAGVGGQGNVLMSRLIGEALISDGYLVSVGETIGMSQRNGSVASQIRISSRALLLPLIPEGQADIIIGLEPLEMMRAVADFGNPNTFVVCNIRPMPPMAVAIGKIENPHREGWVLDKSRKKIEYPALETIKKSVGALVKKACFLDATRIALDLGMPRLTNVIMIGVLIGAGLTPLKAENIRRQIEIDLGKEFLELNLKALEAGLSVKLI